MTTAVSDLPTNTPDNEPGGKMSFFEHLVDLRKRLINSAIAIGIGAMIGVSVSEKVIGFISRPDAGGPAAAPPGRQADLHKSGRIDQHHHHFGIYIGVVLAAPYVLYQVWLFIAPGLYKHERKAVTTFIISSVFLFLAGISFGYYVMLPYMLDFLTDFKGRSGR